MQLNVPKTLRTLRPWSSPQDAISSLSGFWRKVIFPHINFSRQYPTTKSLFGKGRGRWRDKVRKHSMAERWKLKRPSSAWNVTTRHGDRLFSARPLLFLLPFVVIIVDQLQEIYCIYRDIFISKTSTNISICTTGHHNITQAVRWPPILELNCHTCRSHIQPPVFTSSTCWMGFLTSNPCSP